MNYEKPKTVTAYIKWLKSSQNIEIDDRHETHYETVAEKISRDLQHSKFWQEIVSNLPELGDEYLANTKDYKLFALESKPKILIKSYDSFILKTYRKNVIDNENWPDPPDGEWISPENWFAKLNDIVRTMFVVKFLDGAKFFAEKLSLITEKCRLDPEVSYEAREEGYYAIHICVRQEYEIPKLNFKTQIVNVAFEMQITTQLQEVIKGLTHKFYEKRRTKTHPENVNWQWDYKSDEFSANYLGHVLHYMEGMIMGIRDKENGSKL